MSVDVWEWRRLDGTVLLRFLADPQAPVGPPPWWPFGQPSEWPVGPVEVFVNESRVAYTPDGPRAMVAEVSEP